MAVGLNWLLLLVVCVARCRGCICVFAYLCVCNCTEEESQFGKSFVYSGLILRVYLNWT
jgi:hypothetical protein